MSAVAAPSDRRFRRAHVKPGRRRRRWIEAARPVVKAAVLLGLFAYGCYSASAMAAQAHVLKVTRIVVHGNARLASGDIDTLLDGLRGESLVWTDLDAWRKRLIASPWIRDASLRRSFPSTVEIFVTERVPVALGRINGEMFLIDERGVVIDQYGPLYADLDLPIVDGLGARSGDDGFMTDEGRAELAARLIASVSAKPEIARRLSEIDVSDVHNAAVIVDGDPAVIHLGEDQFLQRLESYLDLAAALRERVAHIDYVDLRFEDRIYVRPAGGRRGRQGDKVR